MTATSRSVSVILCGYTMARWDDIARAIRSIDSQTVAPIETILVTDHCDELLQRARATFPQVAVVPNAHRQGLSGARNTAIEMARGDVLAFLDDDAWAGRTWLATLLGHYDSPDVYGVGGSATVVWSGGGRPKWFPREFDWVVGCSYLGQPGVATDVRNLFGCNMSYRREVFELVGGFTSGIGRIGKYPLGCEETELCIRLTQAKPDARIVYDPAAAVLHRASADRRRFQYFRLRCYCEGLSKAIVSQLVGADDGLASERGYVTRVLPRGVLIGLLRLLRGDVTGVLRAAVIVFGLFTTAFGYLRGRRAAERAAAQFEAPVLTFVRSGGRTGQAPPSEEAVA